jgi:hypothetical protein
MLLALALYNLLVAQSTRDKAYLFYGLYLFALAISWRDTWILMLQT